MRSASAGDAGQAGCCQLSGWRCTCNGSLRQPRRHDRVCACIYMRTARAGACTTHRAAPRHSAPYQAAALCKCCAPQPPPNSERSARPPGDCCSWRVRCLPAGDPAAAASSSPSTSYPPSAEGSTCGPGNQHAARSCQQCARKAHRACRPPTPRAHQHHQVTCTPSASALLPDSGCSTAARANLSAMLRLGSCAPP